MITITIKTILHFKKIFGAESAMALPEESTLEDLLNAMAARWGADFRTHIFKPGTNLPEPHIRILINGRDIAFLNGLQTRLQTADEVLIMPPVAGG